jgi:hypothetical protein
MKCPNCDEATTPDHDDRLYCTACGLAGPREVLEALAARLAPAGVLEAAERVLRERGVYTITLRVRCDADGGGVTLRGRNLRKIRSKGTLAGAVARLERVESSRA